MALNELSLLLIKRFFGFSRFIHAVFIMVSLKLGKALIYTRYDESVTGTGVVRNTGVHACLSTFLTLSVKGS